MQKRTYNIGRHLAREQADNIIRDISLAEIDTIELRARGKNINTAVDILEILKRDLGLSESSIQTDTSTLVSREKKRIRVSEIHINCQRGYLSLPIKN